jgi:hypothetical protein
MEAWSMGAISRAGSKKRRGIGPQTSSLAPSAIESYHITMLIRWISGFGSTSQVFSFGGIDASGGIGDTELYYRSVQAVNATIVEDYERLIGNEVGDYVLPVAAVPQTQPAVAGNLSPKQALGRGPGTAKQQLVQGGGSPGGLL